MHQKVRVVVEALDAQDAAQVAQDMFNMNYVGGGAPFDYCQPAHERFGNYSEDDLAFRLDSFEGVAELLKSWNLTLGNVEQGGSYEMLDCYLHDQLWGQVSDEHDWETMVRNNINEVEKDRLLDEPARLWIVPLDTHF